MPHGLTETEAQKKARADGIKKNARKLDDFEEKVVKLAGDENISRAAAAERLTYQAILAKQQQEKSDGAAALLPAESDPSPTGE